MIRTNHKKDICLLYRLTHLSDMATSRILIPRSIITPKRIHTGFVYYLYFPSVNIIKLGKTARGVQRFSDKDYQRTFSFYGEMSELLMYKVSNMNVTEMVLLETYHDNGFETVGNKTEYFRCVDKTLSEELFQQVVSQVESCVFESIKDKEYHDTTGVWRN